MQLTTLTKQSIKGFTLIELLVVIAIIGLLSTIVAAPIQSARKKAKDTKKLAEVRQLQTALANYANDSGEYPLGAQVGGNTSILSILSPQYIPSIPSGFTSASTRDKYMYVSFRGQAPGSAASTTFGYHMGATLEVYNSVLDSDDDCWGVVSTTTPNITGNKNGGGCGNYVMMSSSTPLSAFYFGSTTGVVSGLASGQIGSIGAHQPVPLSSPSRPTHGSVTRNIQLQLLTSKVLDVSKVQALRVLRLISVYTMCLILTKGN
jgi:prepilin-type N-terminal cleavage/methylation domain-containing protein